MRTTTIGAYPKPDYVPIDDRRAGGEEDADTPEPARGYAETVAHYGEARLREILDRATAEVVREQIELGVDIPTDGEVRRENFVHYHCRHLRGVDFERPTATEGRDGRSVPLPTITGPVAAGPPFLTADWRAAQAAARRPVKMTMPGPMTIGLNLADAHYHGDGRQRGADIADALNKEVRALAAAGCLYVQIDEPALARRPDEALAFGIEHLERCFHRIPKEVTRTVHLSRGHPGALDAEDDPEAPQDSYFALAEALDDAAIDAVSLEDAHRPNDLRLLERFARTAVVLGVIDVARSRVEEPDEVRGRLRAALEHIDAHRLTAAPDCGLGLLGRDLARRKLRVLTEAAHGL
ncbi:MAG TPA: cobalamin-independent methionine synthase II family protein [Geminicoccaceae bacterium]|nr:cobalamin-independent methionine synthase II family protein [Geminicoccaceae bacterium]